MLKKVVAVLSVLCLSASVQAGKVTGEIVQLDGQPPDTPLENFQVVATAGGQVLGTGRLTSTVAPFRYELTVDDARLSATDKRVRLTFSATGRQTVSLVGIAGNKDHDVKVILPKDTEAEFDPPPAHPPEYLPEPCPPRKKHRFFGGR
jgi:hypothetical protein